MEKIDLSDIIYIMKTVSGNILLDSKIILEKSQLNEGMRVADLGCGGHGYFVFPLAHAVGRAGTVYAVDILKIMLENVRRKASVENYPNVKTIWSDVEIFGATKIETMSLDKVFLVNILFQSQKRINILREAIRMLKKGGELVIVDWKEQGLPFGPDASSRVKYNLLKEGSHKLGIELREEFSAGQYHNGLIFKKI